MPKRLEEALVAQASSITREQARGGVGAEPEQSPTLTADWHNPAVYPVDEPITMADLNANTAIGYDMVGTLKVGGDAPSVCL